MPRRVDTFVSWALSLLVHVAIAAVLFVTIDVTTPPSAGPQEIETIQATVIDQAQLDAAKRAKEEEARRQAEAERRRSEQLEAERRAREEQQRKAEQEEARRKAEEKERREAEAERRRQVEAEAEAKRRAEEEARRKAEEEARRKAEEEVRRKAEAEARARREAELKQAMAAEQQRQEAIRSGKLAEYQALLTQKVVRNWTPPANLGEAFYCELEVRQIPGGEIASVSIGKCDNDILARSAERAAWKASPLPSPPDRSLFDPIIRIIFSPDTTDQ